LDLICFGRTTVQDVTVQDVTMRQVNYNIEVGNLGSPAPLCLAAFSSRKDFNFLECEISHFDLFAMCI